MSIYKVNKQTDEAYISLSTAFIDKYMPSANATYVLVYIMGLRQCCSKQPLNNSGVAEALGILESDVRRAWLYWEKVGVVRLTDSDKQSFGVEFNDLTIQQPQLAQRMAVQSRPVYTPNEIAIYTQQNSDISELFIIAQEILGKPLSSSDICTIYSFYDWLRLPLEVIPHLLMHCASMGKGKSYYKSMRYIEKVAISWSEAGIDTLERALAYIRNAEEENASIKEIRQILKLTDRHLTDPELEQIKQWLFDYKISPELIKLASEISAMNTSKILLPYMDTILKSWHKSGISTTEQAKLMRSDFKKQAANSGTTGANNKNGQAVNKNKFNNFEQQPYDFKALEQRTFDILRNRSRNGGEQA